MDEFSSPSPESVYPEFSNTAEQVSPSDRIFSAILATGCSPSAVELGATLVDFWVENADDRGHEILAVEVPFYVQLDNTTFVVGVIDNIRRDETGVFASEWKTCRERLAPRGSFAGFNEEIWFDDLAGGHQVSTYAAALLHGEFVWDEHNTFKAQFYGPIWSNWDTQNPQGNVRLFVRAVSKSNPPELWPTPQGAFVEVSEARIKSVLAAYRNAAASVRAMQGTGALPWAVPGIWCVNRFRKVCSFHEKCTALDYEVVRSIGISETDPAMKAVEFLKRSGLLGDDALVLSSSSLSAYLECAEKFRRSGNEESEAMQVGTVLHAGLSEHYKGFIGKSIAADRLRG